MASLDSPRRHGAAHDRRVTLDLSKLLREGKITQNEHDRFLKLGTTATGSLVFNVLIAFGVVAVAAGIIVLVPTPSAGVVIGGSPLAGGLAVYAAGLKAWEVLANICVLVGALVLGGGVIVLTEASIAAFLAIAVGFTVAGAIAGSGLLVCLAVLALSSAIGARTGYEHATYFLGIQEPAFTIALFAALALGTFLVSKALPAAYERLAILAARPASSWLISASGSARCGATASGIQASISRSMCSSPDGPSASSRLVPGRPGADGCGSSM